MCINVKEHYSCDHTFAQRLQCRRALSVTNTSILAKSSGTWCHRYYIHEINKPCFDCEVATLRRKFEDEDSRRAPRNEGWFGRARGKGDRIDHHRSETRRKALDKVAVAKRSHAHKFSGGVWGSWRGDAIERAECDQIGGSTGSSYALFTQEHEIRAGRAKPDEPKGPGVMGPGGLKTYEQT